MRRVVRTFSISIILAAVLPTAAFGQQPQPAQGGPAAAAVSSGFTRSLIGSTGRMLKPGEVTISGIGFIVPLVQVGVTNWFEIGGGALPGAFWVTPKFQVHDGARTKVAAGLVQAFLFGSEGDRAQVSIAYVSATREAGRGALTYGGGVAYGQESGGDSGAAPVFQIGGERQLSRHWWLLTDNYLIGPTAILTAGVRAQGKHASIDLAVPVFLDPDGEALVVVLANFSFRFGG